MTALALDDFGDYFKAVHGHEPFPWQTRLMQRVAEGGWPEVLDLPTGSGKTAALDIALFHLALDAARPASERRAARRIFLIVDRRLIVDQAYERAQRIADALLKPKDDALARVAEALRGLTTGDTPLVTALLRGGLPRDGAWARTPDQPVLGVSTVDQVGSRLLFRGYGVSDSMRPIEAGLLGHDTLFLLDEVHLARPFAQTLEALRRYREHPGRLTARAEVVALSATPRDKAQVTFSLDDEDRADDALSQRLRASKPAALHAVKVKGEEDARRALFAQSCAAQARELQAGGAHTVAVIVNRVDTAQRVFRLLRDEHGLAPLPRDGVTADDSATAPQVALLTGRMRPLDRDARQKTLAARVGAGRDEPRNVGAPLIVVATQCLEAGADYDFDALVTECASLDALRQRFGRLDRLGRHGNARGVILAREDQLRDDADDPIYGSALAATWHWLDARKPLDFGFERLPEPDDDTREKLLAPARDAPILLPAHLDAWVQTSPPGPQHDPDVALWLHGPDAEPPDVQIVWRADLDADALRAGSHVRPTLAERGEIDDRAAALLELCPPRSCEALPLPLHAAKRWLRGQPPADVADVEGARAQDDDDARGLKAARRERTALRFRQGKAEPVSWFELSPGDLLIVPSSYGGLDPESDTWDPGSREPVRDVGDLAQVSEQRRTILRLTPAYLDAWGLHGAPPRDEDESDAEWKERLREWLARVPPNTGLENVLERFRDESDCRTSGDALVATRTKDDDRKARAESALSLDPEVSSFTEVEVEVTLEQHCEDVRKRARDFAERCGLPAAIVDDIALAAWLHDVGKADPRFQSWLRNDVVPATQNLAKSSLGPHDRRAREAALKLSGYPRGGRHELLSVALIDDSPALKDAHDRDLVLHLVASHHGHARPFVPYAPDPAPREVVLAWDGATLRASTAHGLESFGSPVPEIFWRLVRKYGWYGLARCEAILRLADHRCSEEETGR